MWGVDLNLSGAVPNPGVPRLLFTTHRRPPDYQVTPDGQRFLVAPGTPREAGNLSVALNWQGLLR